MNKRKLSKAVQRIRHLPKGRHLISYSLNKLRHFAHKISGSTKVARPSTIMLELTNLCNLRCTTCPREYEYGKRMDKGSMLPAQAKRIIDELWPCLDSIGLTGMGETLLYRELAEIVDYIRSRNKGIIISLSTNAMAPDFNEKVLPLIGKVDTIQVSMDGLGDVYEKIRLNTRFNTFNANLEKLVKACRNTGTLVMPNMVITKENYHQMHAVIDYAADLGISFFNFAIFNVGAVTSLDADYYTFFKSLEFLSEKRLTESRAKARGVEISSWDFKNGNGFRACLFPWTHFTFTWDGYAVPCCSKPFPKELNFGNVFENGVMAVLNGAPYRAFRKLWFKNQTPDFCAKCHFIEIGRT